MMYDLEYFASRKWGDIVEDDKYWDDHELEDNFLVFYNYAFAWLNLEAPSRAQLVMAEHVMKKTSSHRMLMCERGLAKSLTSQIYVVWRLLNNPDEKILVMSAGAKRAVNYTYFVQKLIKLLPITKPMSPRHNIERTSGQSFDVAGSAESDSPSVYAVGAGNQITGFRATLIIYDDIETPQTVESSVLSEKIDTYAAEAQNLLMPEKDESITLCTPHSMDSIYIPWITKGYDLIVIPAQYPENDNMYFNSLAPYIKERIESDPSIIGQAVDERLNLDFLMGKKLRIGRSTYKLQYMIDVSESDDVKHPLKLSDFIVMDVDDDQAPMKISHSSMPDNRLYIKHNGFKNDKLFSPSYVSELRQPYEMKIMSIDPSGRGKDELGISIIYSLNTRLFIKKVTGLEGGYDDEVFRNIVDLCNIHGINTIVVESNYGDGAFVRLLDPHIARNSPNTEIDEIRVKGQKEVRIIEAMEPMLNQHRIVIDKTTLDKDNESLKDYSFTEQMTKITKTRDSLRHDDRLDATANGIIYMMDKMATDEDWSIKRIEEEQLQKELDKVRDLAGNMYKKVPLNYGARF